MLTEYDANHGYGPEDFDDEDDRGFDHDDGYGYESSTDCVFPGRCCMPADHYSWECHTAEMYAAWHEEIEQAKRARKEGKSNG